jgi:hypothetical protein
MTDLSRARRIVVLAGLLIAFPTAAFLALALWPFDADGPHPGVVTNTPGDGGLRRPFPKMAIRPGNEVTAERVALGRLFYFDPVLSGGNDLSCATHPYLRDERRAGGVRHDKSLRREGRIDIWVSTRETLSEPWSAPIDLESPVNSEFDDGSPWLSRDGTKLYFFSTRPDGGYGKRDIWYTTRAKGARQSGVHDDGRSIYEARPRQRRRRSCRGFFKTSPPARCWFVPGERY